MFRTKIEYVCPVWNPHQQYLSDKLQRIQRNASRWILSKDIAYDGRLLKLRWMDLKTRQANFLNLTQIFKYIKGFCIVNLADYVKFQKFSTCRTRCTSIVTRSGNPMHVQISFSIPFGIDTLLS